MLYLEADDGTRLCSTEGGTGKPVDFVSAWALGGAMWEYQMGPLSEGGLRCIALDWRGHGRSEDPERGYDMDTLADDLASLMHQLDLGEVTLMGNSMGCCEIVRSLTRHGAGRVVRIEGGSAKTTSGVHDQGFRPLKVSPHQEQDGKDQPSSQWSMV